MRLIKKHLLSKHIVYCNPEADLLEQMVFY